MTVTASPAQSDARLPVVADATTGRTWANRAELYEVCEFDSDKRGVQNRLNAALFENVWATYNVLRKRAAITGGPITISTRQIARDLYPDVGDDIDRWRDKRASIKRWLKLLERQGLIRLEQLRSSGGKYLGLRVELMAVSEVAALSRGCSSAG